MLAKHSVDHDEIAKQAKEKEGDQVTIHSIDRCRDPL
jgi:hypothetical protein